MSDEMQKANSNIISTKDLGQGRKEITFETNDDALKSYIDMFDGNQSGKYKLGKGSVLNRYDTATRSRYSPTSNDDPYTQVYSGLPTDPHRKIQLAVELYFKEPIVGSVIDMMVDFSSSGFTNECDDEDVKKIYDKWCEEMNISELLERIFLEYYRSGNVTIYRNNNNSKVRKKTRKASSDEVNIQEYQFPSAYTVLNPMNVYVNGSMLFNKEIIQLMVSSDLQNFVNNPNTPNGYISDLPTDIIKDLRSGSSLITLDPDFTSRITRKKMDYERYASPFLERVFEPIMYKAKLRMMDMSTIEGLVNQLVTVTVGDENFPATDEDLIAIAELFQTPSKAYTVFWNHTLQVKFHKPEGIDTLTADKYDQVNEDIMAGLGVSRILLDGSGSSNFSSSWISILSFIERLDNSREKVKHWLESEYRRIAQENGFSSYPRVRFNHMNLREDTYIRDVLLAMYDRGLIDEEDILTETGRDYQSVVDQKKRNEKNSEMFLPPEQPFQGGQTGPNNPNNTGSPGGKQSKKRETNPESDKGEGPKKRKATASYSKAEEDYENELELQYSIIESEVASIIEQNKNEDDRIKSILIMSTVMSLFKAFSFIGYNHIQKSFDTEMANHTDSPSASAVVTKRDLRDWNDGYVAKLANDINNEISNAMIAGKSISEAVSSVFEANKYRVSLMSQAGILESVRQASIIGSELTGSRTALWISRLDEKTCPTCRGLHGRSFALADIPPRPHSGCRCSLQFD